MDFPIKQAQDLNKYGSLFLYLKRLFTILLLVVIISILGIYFILKSKQQSSQQQSNPVISVIPTQKTISPVPDDITTWKTYRSKLGNFSFKYPPHWKVKVDYWNLFSKDSLITNSNGESIIKGESEEYHEDIIFTSPQGFELVYLLTSPQGGPDFCKPKDQCFIVTNYNSTPVKINGWKTLYLINGSYDSNPNYYRKTTGYKAIYLSEIEEPNQPIIVGTSMEFNAYVKSKNNPSLFIYFVGQYPENSPEQKFTPEEYFKLPDIETAKKIIKSLSY